MAKSNMLWGSPILVGDNTIPGIGYTPEQEKMIPEIIQACLDFGIDPYPPIIEMLTYDEISEVAAYEGFPKRYPHWRFGMAYERLSRQYEYGMGVIYEMIANNNPALMYCLASNTFTDHVTVIAHALFHSDFFKNNMWFEPTTKNALNQFADHGTRIQRYMNNHGQEKVVQFMDWCLSIDDLVDYAAAWNKRKMETKQIVDQKKHYKPRRLKVDEDSEYMDEWINDESWKSYERQRLKEKEAKDQLNILIKPDKDIMKYLLDHAPLDPWQADTLAIMYREALYFAPQRVTKTVNEGWASYGDHQMMARLGWAKGEGIVHYAQHKAGVLGGKYSMNPYALGFKILLNVEERWNKGKFGREWELCDDAEKKKNWDKKLGLGKEKVFEVRKYANDLSLIQDYVDQDFIDKYEMFHWKAYPAADGGIEYKIESRDAKVIRKLLMEQFVNGGRPDIRLADPNYANKKIFFLQHFYDGRMLEPKYARDTLKPIWHIWNNSGFKSKNVVAIATRNKDGEEIVYVCMGPKETDDLRLTRKQFEAEFAL